jgi:hypothetical protein
MSTPRHCPGFESFKELSSFICRCQQCGAEKEIFSDEFDREHLCKKCQAKIDFAACEFEAGGETHSPR